MANLAPKEQEIDQLIAKLLRNLDAAATKEFTVVDLPLNLQYFTFDAGGVVAFSQPYGFLDKQKDLDGIIQNVRVGSTHLNRVCIQSHSSLARNISADCIFDTARTGAPRTVLV